MTANDFIKEKLPFLYGTYLTMNEIRLDKQYIAERKCFGEMNPSKTFLVVKINNHKLGLMGIYNCVLGYLRIANKFGYHTVVDLKNYNNGYLEPNEIGVINAWEYYFEQPSIYSLDEVYQSKNVYIATGASTKEASPIPMKYYYLSNNIKANKYYEIIKQQMVIKKDILSKIDIEYKEKIAGRRVIGVVKRGTDIINAPGHAVQPALEDLIILTKEKLIEWNCQYVFLATEEAKTVEIFSREFKDKLLINESARVKIYNNGIAYSDVSFNREYDKYYKGIEYLTTVTLLSKCNCLIGSAVGATIGSLGMNMGKYEHTYLFKFKKY